MIGHHAEHDLIEVRQALGGQVVVGITLHGVVIARYALTQHERTTRHCRLQVLTRGQDLIRGHTAKDVLRHRSVQPIRPNREERREWSRQVEGDRQIVRGDGRRFDQVEAGRTGRGKLRVCPEFPGVIHIPCIQGLAIGPFQP